MPSTRIAIAAALIAAAGCSRPAPPTRAADPAAAVPATAAPTAATAPADPAAFARDFLAAVNAGTATPAMLTPEFKRVIADPVFESDATNGYSDHAAASWLAQFKGQLPSGSTTVPGMGSGGEAPGFAGGAGPRHAAFALRVAPAAGGWRADWFAVAPGVAWDQGSQPGSPPGFAAVAFLQALLAKDDRLAAALLSPAVKARLAPPFASDKSRGYNEGILAGKLSDLCGAADGYRLVKMTGPAATAELLAGLARKPVDLKLVQGPRAWDWLVDDIDSK